MLLALAAALSWGGSDFFGGLASRRNRPIAVLAVSRVSLMLVLIVCALAARDPLPSWPAVWWSAAAGISGAFGLAALYSGLALGRSGHVMPTAGVVGAALPVLFGAVVEGVLPAVRQIGLVVSLVGIWLVSEGHRPKDAEALRGVGMGAAAGLGFGGFFILLGQVDSDSVFLPFVLAGLSGTIVAVLVVWLSGPKVHIPIRDPQALWAGALDAGGLLCYGLAVRLIRLDVAAVLSSLFPAVAVLLFWGITKESISREQWIGLVVCLVAIALIVG